VVVEAVTTRLAGAALAALVADADVVLDCCDNFATRHAVNRACVSIASRWFRAQRSALPDSLPVFDSRRGDTPCYNCLFPEAGEVEEVRCAVMGVFAPLTGIIGAMQAAEALKLIAGCRRGGARPSLAARRSGDGMAQREIRQGSAVSGLRAVALN
jgi:molybdopterin/thiamine biosynthesis adenylyltransferase